jgi:hypothetical protein
MFKFNVRIFLKQRNGIYTKDPEMEKKNVEMDSYMPCDALAHKLSLVGQCISCDFRKLVATIFSKPGRASNYSVDGTVYAGLIRRMAEFLTEP